MRQSRTIAWTLALVFGVLPLGSARAEAPAEVEKKSQEHEATWVVREGGKVVGTEAIKVVLSPTDTYFFSGSFVPKGKRSIKVLTHLQRDPDGKLRKYRRLQKKRKGKGVHAFQKAELVRIVGVNDDAAPVVFEGALGRHVWDPIAWHPMQAWLAAMGAAEPPSALSVVDIANRRLRKVGLERVGAKSVGNTKGEAVEVTEWRLDGLGDTPLTVLAGEGPHLVGATQGERDMLLKGWTWEVPEPEPAEGEPTEGAEGKEGEAAPEGSPAEAPDKRDGASEPTDEKAGTSDAPTPKPEPAPAPEEGSKDSEGTEDSKESKSADAPAEDAPAEGEPAP